jgi:hypothetical protein
MLLLTAQAGAPAHAASPAAACPNPLGASAADTANPLSDKFLGTLKAAGISTIARYYDYVDETLPGKTLTLAERDLVAAHRMSLIVVFQHHNDQLASFTPERGTGDAKRALELAAKLRQPKGSAVYFGVDGGWKSEADQAKIAAYFKAAHAVMAEAGYRVGVYGSGLSCARVITAGNGSLCWLANPKSWPGTSWALAHNAWSIRQGTQVLCGGIYVDFDRPNGKLPDVGQWQP